MLVLISVYLAIGQTPAHTAILQIRASVVCLSTPPAFAGYSSYLATEGWLRLVDLGAWFYPEVVWTRPTVKWDLTWSTGSSMDGCPSWFHQYEVSESRIKPGQLSSKSYSIISSSFSNSNELFSDKSQLTMLPHHVQSTFWIPLR